MRTVEIGNPRAIEGFRDEPDGELKYRELPGDRTTSFQIPDDMTVAEAAQVVIVTMSAHMEAGVTPPWITSSDATLQAYLCNHYGVSPTKARPASWGKQTDGERKEPKKRAPRRPAAVPVETPGTDEEGEG